MNDNDLVIAVAKLDGHNPEHLEICGHEREQKRVFLVVPNVFPAKCLDDYLTSRDAIIPVIEKQHWRNVSHLRVFHLALCEQIKSIDENTPLESNIQAMIEATPKHLAIALVKATGGWKE